MSWPKAQMPAAAVGSRRPRGIVVVAGSAGGLRALIDLLGPLPPTFPLPILVAQHLSPRSGTELAKVLGWRTQLLVKWAEHGEWPEAGVVYVCPPRQHLLLAPAGDLALRDVAEGGRFTPSADLLFKSAAAAFGSRAIGLILSGMLDDGALGTAAINRAGGITMAQSEASCGFFDMPAAAIDFGRAELIGSPQQIGTYLMFLGASAPPPVNA